MIIVLLIIHVLITQVNCNETNNFITDYFRYKGTSSVIGYSCNDFKADISLIKALNDIDIPVALKKIHEQFRIYHLAHADYHRVGIFLDTRCLKLGEVVSIFLDATNYRMYDELHDWLILGYNLTDIAYMIDDRAFGVSTDFVIAVSLNDDADYYELYDVYNSARERGGSLKITYFGNWFKDGNLKVDLKKTKYFRRSNLRGITLKAAFYKTVYKSNETALEEYFNDYAHAQKDGLSKFGFNVVHLLSVLLNFSLKCHESPEWQANDKLGPMVRSLINSEADLTGNPISMNAARTYLIKFVHQDWPFRTCFIFRNPQPKNIKIREMFRPLADQVWFLLLILMSSSIIMLAFVASYEWPGSKIMQLSKSFTIVIGALCQQGTTMQINNMSTRLTFLSVLIFTYLIYTYYSAGVVTARLNEPIRKINDSLSELAKLSLKFSSEYMVYFDFYIKRPDWETAVFYTKKWQTLPEHDRFMPPETAMQLVREGGFAYHAHPDVTYPIIERFYTNREICELTEVHLARPSLATFAVALNSTIVETVRVGLTKINEVGLRTRQLHRWQYRKPPCREDVFTASSVNVYEFSPHLLLLFIGYLLALLICSAEIFVAHIIPTIKKSIFKPTEIEILP